MFRETLLESSPALQHRKRWPLAVAFLLESVIAGAAIVVPWLSAGVIPVAAHPPIIAPRLRGMRLADSQGNHRPPRGSASAARYATAAVVALNLNGTDKSPIFTSSDEDQNFLPPGIPAGDDKLPLYLTDRSNFVPPSPPPRKKVRPSVMSEAMLVHRVEPVYPRIAQMAGITGTVKLHAIIGKDGSIQSLSLISGHPILAAAALEAVQEWRYRPYFLNGEAVEVETFIAVNFRKEGNH